MTLDIAAFRALRPVPAPGVIAEVQVKEKIRDEVSESLEQRQRDPPARDVVGAADPGDVEEVLGVALVVEADPDLALRLISAQHRRP